MNIQSIDSRRLKMTAGFACAILGFAALAGQSGGQAAAASESQVRATDNNVTLAAGPMAAHDSKTSDRSTDWWDLPAKAKGAVEAAKAAKPADSTETEADTQTRAEASKAKRNPRPAKPAEVAPVAGLDQTQMTNAEKIVAAAREMGLGRDAQIIAVATAMQESTLYNRASTVLPESYDMPHEGDGSDYDSVGLFQQRTSTGWGPVKDLMNPEFATKQFLKALVQVPNWEHLPLTVAAQTVQGSAFPDHYAKHEAAATAVVDAINGSH